MPTCSRSDAGRGPRASDAGQRRAAAAAGANAMAMSLAAGERVTLSKVDAFADGVAVKQARAAGRAGRVGFQGRRVLTPVLLTPVLLSAECSCTEAGRGEHVQAQWPAAAPQVGAETLRPCRRGARAQGKAARCSRSGRPGSGPGRTTAGRKRAGGRGDVPAVPAAGGRRGARGQRRHQRGHPRRVQRDALHPGARRRGRGGRRQGLPPPPRAAGAGRGPRAPGSHSATGRLPMAWQALPGVGRPCPNCAACWRQVDCSCEGSACSMQSHLTSACSWQ